jgi:hypothetical protein
VALADPSAVVETVLMALSQRADGAFAAGVRRQASSLPVRRAAPEWTASGKLPPIRLRASTRKTAVGGAAER